MNRFSLGLFPFAMIGFVCPVLFGAEVLQFSPPFTGNLVLKSQISHEMRRAKSHWDVEIESGIAQKSTFAKLDNKEDFVVDIVPLPQGGPYELGFGTKAQQSAVLLKNVLVGEVWVCSGQSNMQWTVNSSDNVDHGKNQSGNSRICLFTVPRKSADQPGSSLNGKWLDGNSVFVGDFFAVVCDFGKKISTVAALPVGPINASWGGKCSEPLNPRDEPEESNWAELREAQLLTAFKFHKTGIALITGPGDEKDIIPRNKAFVGERLGKLGLKNQYQKIFQALGRLFKMMTVEGNEAILEFSGMGTGLELRGGKLSGFTIAGPKRESIHADARIDFNKAFVVAKATSEPNALRYRWANFPVANLWNREGLPASHFRTDDF